MDQMSSMPSDLLIRRLRHLVDRDRALSAELLAHISEVDARKLYCEAACSSMFMYCTDILGMSEAQAYKRIRAARLARRYPQIFSMCSAGQVHLSTLCLLTPHLTDENVGDLLRQVTYKSKREAERLLAAMAPSPPVPDKMRRLPRRRRKKSKNLGPKPMAPELPGLHSSARARKETTNLGLRGARILDAKPGETSEESPVCCAPPETRPRRSKMSPLSGEAYKIEFTASEAQVDKLRQAQELMRHQVPDGDLATVVERALDALLPALRKQRFAEVARPRQTTDNATSSSSEVKPERKGTDMVSDIEATAAPRGEARPRRPRSRHIPAAVKRKVARRDGYQCTFTDPTGRRCPERGMLEYHHDFPFGKGGEHPASNVRLVCRAHNQWEAARDYGQAVWTRRSPNRDSDGGDQDGFVPGDSRRSSGAAKTRGDPCR